MIPRHRLDVSASDLLYALGACVAPRSDEGEALEAFGLDESEGLVCLSARSGLDLLLAALSPPAGSEFLVSAVTHPDMARILERHGVVPVPVDLVTATLEPRIELAEAAVTERTRGILVAHLFGGTVNLAPIAALARRRGLLLVEDCAQSLGASPRGGDGLADVSLFSFGPIKTATALGGGFVRVPDAALLGRMRELQAAWPAQTRAAYAARVARFAVLAALARPTVYGTLARLVDVDRVTGSVRGFSGAGDERFDRMRLRPSAALVSVLARRLRSLDLDRIDARARSGEALAALLSPRFVRPGAGAPGGTHWVFPVVAPDPASLVEALRRAGFDAGRATAIAAVAAPEGRPEASEARAMVQGLVFLPAYPELGPEALARLAAAANASLEPAQSKSSRSSRKPRFLRFPRGSSS